MTSSEMLSSDRSSRSARARGFTLIEVIVALLIATMIVTVIFSGLGIAFDAWAATTARIDELNTDRYALRALRRQLESALPLSTVIEDGLTRTSVLGFEADAGSMRFVSHATFSMGPASPARWVEWEIEDDGGIHVREYDIVPPDNRPASEPAWEGVFPVTGRAGSLQFEYRRPRTTLEPPGFTGEWTGDWDPTEQRTIPAAVRVASPSDVTGTERFWMLIHLDYAGAAADGMRLE